MKTNEHKQVSTSRSRGFTLLELVVSLSVLSVLVSIGAMAMGGMKKRAQMMRELSAGRALMQAFHFYSTENNGAVLPGYKSDEAATNERGRVLSSPMNARYPWRIFPYVQEVESALLFNGNQEVLGGAHSDYLVSVVPNFGMNTTFVGGHFGSGSLLRPTARIEQKVGRFAIRHTGDGGGQIIAFCSARSTPDADWEGKGYFEVQPPKVIDTVWSDSPWKEDSAPAAHGFVDLRWGGKAVVAMLDGSARTMDEQELRDMRNWSVGAAAADDPNFTVFSQ